MCNMMENTSNKNGAGNYESFVLCFLFDSVRDSLYLQDPKPLDFKHNKKRLEFTRIV